MANGAAPPRTTIRPQRSLAVFALIGAALMAALDEIVFHQILHWHHFYDRSTPGVGLLSDGLLHTAEICALAAGAVLYADLRRLRALSPPHARAGLLLGLGASRSSTASSTTSCCACTRSATEWTSPPTTGCGTPPGSCCSSWEPPWRCAPAAPRTRRTRTAPARAPGGRTDERAPPSS